MSTWKLPNEISLEIFSHLPKEDIFNLYCVSHQLRAVSASTIYRDVNLDSSRGHTRWNQIALFLRTIILNPDIRASITKARIKWSGDRDSNLNKAEGSRGKSDYDRGKLGGQMDIRYLIIYKTPKLGVKITPQLQSAVLQGSESSQVMILLMLLDNLEEVRITVPPSAEHFRHEIIELARSGKYFSKLKLFELLEEGVTIPSWIPIPYIESFRHTPAVRASRLGFSDRNGDFARNPPRNASVSTYITSPTTTTSESLPLVDFSLSIASFDSEWLSNMLNLSNTVQNLNVSFTGLNKDECLTIPRLCGMHLPTLQKLTVSLPGYRRFYYGGSYIDKCLLELSQQNWEVFKALKYLRGPLDVLFGSFFPDPSMAILNMKPNPIIFPRSLETIHFTLSVFQRSHPYGGGISFWDDDQIYKLLCLAFSDCESKYPKLSKIYVGCGSCQPFISFQDFLIEQGKPSEMVVYCGFGRADCKCRCCTQPRPRIY